MRTQAAVAAGKLIWGASRRLKIGGGSSAPGLYALKVDPNLISNLSKFIHRNIIITGTNGKTTTAKLLACFAKENNLSVIRNSTGSNLERGIASALIHHIGLGKKKYDLGIWELDEAAFNTVAPKLNPRVVIFLNAFRDQLDRYGEVDTVVENWRKTLQNVGRDTQIIVNGDDTNTAKLIASLGKPQTFGLEELKIFGEGGRVKKAEPNLLARKIQVLDLKGSSFEVDNQKIYLPLPGIYHIYDFLGAFAVGKVLGFSVKSMVKSLKRYRPAFGRVEKLEFGYIFLIKNPVGATQVLKTIVPNLDGNASLLIALNDNFADGTDVSWIWDTEFENLAGIKNKIYCSGIRAEDLALRLKYAGIESEQLKIEADIKHALKEAREETKGRLFVLPTYTAMLKLQEILTKEGLKKPYWEEE